MNGTSGKSKTKPKVRPSKQAPVKSAMTFGESLIAGLTELRDALESGEPLEKRFTVRTITLDIKPARQYTPADVKTVRERLNASQALLAMFLGVSTHTVSQWEQGLRKPPTVVCRYLDDLQEYPELWTKRLKSVQAK